jgi:hypothetical protein
MTERSTILCTKDQPWDHQPRPGTIILHPDADEVGEQRDGWPGGDLVDVRCPNCGHVWTKELPQ